MTEEERSFRRLLLATLGLFAVLAGSFVLLFTYCTMLW